MDDAWRSFAVAFKKQLTPAVSEVNSHSGVVSESPHKKIPGNRPGLLIKANFPGIPFKTEVGDQKFKRSVDPAAAFFNESAVLSNIHNVGTTAFLTGHEKRDIELILVKLQQKIFQKSSRVHLYIFHQIKIIIFQ